VRDVKKAIEQAPDYLDAHIKLAELLARPESPDLPGAREALHRALKLAPNEAALKQKLDELYKADTLTPKEIAEFIVQKGFAGDDSPFLQKQRRTLAVLPFTPTGDETPAELGYGIARAEQLLFTRLSGIEVTSGLGVGGQGGEASKGRALKVAAVLGGTVRVQGDTVTLTGRLVDSAEGTVLVTAEVHGKTADVFKLCQDLALTVAYGFVRLSVAEEKRLLDTPATSVLTLRQVGRAQQQIEKKQDEPARVLYAEAATVDPVWVNTLPEALALFDTHIKSARQQKLDFVAQRRAAELARLQAEAASFDARFMYSGIGVAAAGVIALGIGAYFGIDSGATGSQVTAATPLTKALELERKANDEAVIATGLLIGGGVAAALGGTLIAVGLLRTEEVTLDPSFDVSLTQGGASASMTLHW
jgi:TolB-like protein